MLDRVRQAVQAKVAAAKPLQQKLFNMVRPRIRIRIRISAVDGCPCRYGYGYGIQPGVKPEDAPAAQQSLWGSFSFLSPLPPETATEDGPYPPHLPNLPNLPKTSQALQSGYRDYEKGKVGANPLLNAIVFKKARLFAISVLFSSLFSLCFCLPRCVLFGLSLA